MEHDVEISVIVPTRNRAPLLRECLRSLFAQGPGAPRYEVIVVDDASTDETPRLLQASSIDRRLRSIQLPVNLGQAAAKNEGAARASGRILLFLDDDMQAGPGCLSAHLRAHDGEPRVVFGPIRTTGHPAAPCAEAMLAASLERKFHRLANNPAPVWPVDATLMPNSSLPRELFVRHGGFDADNFPRRREDEEFGIRLWKHGVQFVFAPAATASHQWDKAHSLVEREWIEGGGALVRLYRKHPELAGTQPVFGRLLRLPRWTRHVVFAIARNRSLISACVSAMGLWRSEFERANLARAMFSLAGALAESGGQREFSRIFCPNAMHRT